MEPVLLDGRYREAQDLVRPAGRERGIRLEERRERPACR